MTQRNSAERRAMLAKRRVYQWNRTTTVNYRFDKEHGCLMPAPFIRATRNNDPSYRTGGSITGGGSREKARLSAAKPVKRSRAKKAAA